MMKLSLLDLNIHIKYIFIVCAVLSGYKTRLRLQRRLKKALCNNHIKYTANSSHSMYVLATLYYFTFHAKWVGKNLNKGMQKQPEFCLEYLYAISSFWGRPVDPTLDIYSNFVKKIKFLCNNSHRSKYLPFDLD